MFIVAAVFLNFNTMTAAKHAVAIESGNILA
jgi:hypothetical protein